MVLDARTPAYVKVYSDALAREFYFNTSTSSSAPAPNDPAPTYPAVQTKTGRGLTQGTIVADFDAPPAVGNLLLCDVAVDKNAGSFSLPAAAGWEFVTPPTSSTSVSGALLYRVATGATQDTSVSLDWSGPGRGAFVLSEVAFLNAELLQAAVHPSPVPDTAVTSVTGGAGVAGAAGLGVSGFHVDTPSVGGWDGNFPSFSAGYRRLGFDGDGPTGGAALAVKDLAALTDTAHTASQGAADQAFMIVARFGEKPAGGTVLTNRLTWQPQGEGAAPILSFTLQRRVYTNGIGGAWETIASPAASARTHDDVGVKTSTKYGYRLRVWNKYGPSDYSAERTFTTPV